MVLVEKSLEDMLIEIGNPKVVRNEVVIVGQQRLFSSDENLEGAEERFLLPILEEIDTNMSYRGFFGDYIASALAAVMSDIHARVNNSDLNAQIKLIFFSGENGYLVRIEGDKQSHSPAEYENEPDLRACLNTSYLKASYDPDRRAMNVMVPKPTR